MGWKAPDDRWMDLSEYVLALKGHDFDWNCHALAVSCHVMLLAPDSKFLLSLPKDVVLATAHQEHVLISMSVTVKTL